MSETTNWGDVTQSLLVRLDSLVDENVARQVQAATEDEVAAYAPKSFPALALVWKGTTLEKAVTLLSNGFEILERGHWELHHFCSTGRSDATGMFQKDGPFHVTLASREKLLGFFPEGQISNAYQLRKGGDGSIQRFTTTRGGSGGMNVIVPYYLDQMIRAVGA